MTKASPAIAPAIAPARAKRAQFALLLTFFMQGFITISPLPRIPEFIALLHINFTVWGLITGFSVAGALLPLAFTNQLINRLGTTPIIRLSVLLLVACLISQPLTNNPYIFFAIYSTQAFALSAFNIALNAQSVMFQKKLGQVILGKLHGAWSIGAALSSAFTGAIAKVVSLQSQMLFVPLVGLIVLLWACSQMLQPSEDGHAFERPDKANKIGLLKTPRYLLLLVAGLIAGMFPELVVMDWSAVYSKSILHLDKNQAALPYTLFVMAMIAGRFSVARLANGRHLSRVSQAGGLFGALAMALAIGGSTLLAASNNQLALLVLCVFFIVAGFGIASMVPSYYSAAGHITGMTTAQALSRMSLINSTLIIGFKFAMGALADGIGLSLAFVFPIVLFAAAGVISGLVADRAEKIQARKQPV